MIILATECHTRVFILFRFDTANCVPVPWRQFGSFVYLIINSVTYMTTVSTYTGCPTRDRTRHVFNNLTVSQQLVARQTHTTDTFLFISHTTNVPLIKFRCNILIGVRISGGEWDTLYLCRESRGLRSLRPYFTFLKLSHNVIFAPLPRM